MQLFVCVMLAELIPNFTNNEKLDSIVDKAKLQPPKSSVWRPPCWCGSKPDYSTLAQNWFFKILEVEWK